MIPDPKTRDEALQNAIGAAGEAHRLAGPEGRSYHAQTWSMVADAWSRIACQLPDIRLMADDEETVTLAEVTTPRSGADLARQMRDSGLVEGLPSAQRIVNDLTEDELDTIAALRAGTLKVVMTPGSGVDPGVAHTEDTMHTVRRVLAIHFDLTEEQVTDAIHAFQNAGILFRERMSDGHPEIDPKPPVLTPDEIDTIMTKVPMTEGPRIEKDGDMVQALRAFLSFMIQADGTNWVSLSVKDFVKHGRTNFRLQRSDTTLRLVIDE